MSTPDLVLLGPLRPGATRLQARPLAALPSCAARDRAGNNCNMATESAIKPAYDRWGGGHSAIATIGVTGAPVISGQRELVDCASAKRGV